MARIVVNRSAFEDPRLYRIESYIRAHLSDPKRLSTRRAAHMANLCPEAFCRFFRERVGVCFTEWQRAFRAAAAKPLLVNTRLPIERVGEAVGYANAPTFTRVFVRYQGVTPSQLRKFVRRHPELKNILVSTPWPKATAFN